MSLFFLWDAVQFTASCLWDNEQFVAAYVASQTRKQWILALFAPSLFAEGVIFPECLILGINSQMQRNERVDEIELFFPDFNGSKKR